MSTTTIALSPIVSTLCSELPLRYSADEFAQLLANFTTADRAMPPRLRNIVQRCKTAIIRFNSKMMEANTTPTHTPSFFTLRRKQDSEKDACVVKILIAVVDGFEAAYDPAHPAYLGAGDGKFSGRLELPEDLFNFERRPSHDDFTKGIVKSLSHWGTSVQDSLFFIKPFVANTSEDEVATAAIGGMWSLRHLKASTYWTGAISLSMGSLMMLQDDANWGSNGLPNRKVYRQVLPALCFIFAISPIVCLGQCDLSAARTFDIRDLLQNIARHAGTLRSRIHENRAFRNIEHTILRAIGESLEQTHFANFLTRGHGSEKIYAGVTELAKPIQTEWDMVKASVESVEVDGVLQYCMNYGALKKVTSSDID